MNIDQAVRNLHISYERDLTGILVVVRVATQTKTYKQMSRATTLTPCD